MPPLFENGTALVDGATWQTALLAAVSETLQSTLNEFGISVQIVFAPTDATVSYEKDALIIQCETQDVCDPNSGVMKMTVAGDFRNKISGNNPAGYAYGAYIEVGCDPGSAGQLSGLEIGGNNQGPPCADYGKWGAGGLLTLVAGEYAGCNNLTTGISIVPGTAKYNDAAIVVETGALIPGAAAFRLISNVTGKDIFRITDDGTLQYTKLEQIT
jgi:hypothetical protein